MQKSYNKENNDSYKNSINLSFHTTKYPNILKKSIKKHNFP